MILKRINLWHGLVDFPFFNLGLVSAIIEVQMLLGSVHFPIDMY